MKTIFTAFILGLSLAMSGCVPSVNPFYTDADVYFDRNLLGEWSDDDGSESWAFEAGVDNDYKLTYTDEEKKTGVFTARLFKLGERSFLDIVPSRSVCIQNDFYIGHLLPLHTFVQIAINGKSGHVSYLDSAWLARLLNKNPNAVQHSFFNSDIFLTDTTKNLQAFLVANIETPEAFVKSTELKRKPFRK
ncbi:MAG: hypothetical protein ACJ72Z_08725 [Pyrinomonadaceae bacterium]